MFRIQTGYSPRDVSPTSRQPTPQAQYPRPGDRTPPAGNGAQPHRLPVRTSSVPSPRDPSSSERTAAQDREQRERRDRDKERERQREREHRDREKVKEAAAAPPPAPTPTKKQEQRISTMTESQIMEKLRKLLLEINGVGMDGRTLTDLFTL